VILLDTDVMVDVLKGHVPARGWLASVTLQEIGIPGLVAMELLQGCRDAREQRRVERTLGTYPLYWPSGEDCARALTWFAACRIPGTVTGSTPNCGRMVYTDSHRGGVHGTHEHRHR